MASKSSSTTTRARRVGLKAAAEYADLSVVTMRRRIAAGVLPAYRSGPKLIKVDLDDVDAMLRRIPTVDNGAA